GRLVLSSRTGFATGAVLTVNFQQRPCRPRRGSGGWRIRASFGPTWERRFPGSPPLPGGSPGDGDRPAARAPSLRSENAGAHGGRTRREPGFPARRRQRRPRCVGAQGTALARRRAQMDQSLQERWLANRTPAIERASVRRVVVTGLGVVAPSGIGADAL